MNHRPRKRFGQNFLRDEAVINAIEQAVAPRESEHVVEIGPGTGVLTEAILKSGCRLDVIELDRDLTAGLLASFSIYPRFTLHSADALTFDFASLSVEGEQIRVIGNLPYNISTPLIMRLLEQTDLIHDMHFMLQLEVVQRLAAKPGTKAWGRLGVMAQYYCEVEQLFDVPPEAFFPAPKVQSAVVRLTPRQTQPEPDLDVALFRKVVAQAFSQRRKTLHNNFKNTHDDATLRATGIDPAQRAETLELDDFIALARLAQQVIKTSPTE